LHWSR